ncbi:hypothetical protein VB694_17445 [Anabaena sp. UHCC 0451]|nr:hypothetical protein [Anabaena sp. UHCC 0451]MEA5578206.1 hypothetical protein [Anabaena sp. UHCC 0451]
MGADTKKINTIWIADGSSLEQLRKRLKISEDNSSKLGGKIMMIVEAFTLIFYAVLNQLVSDVAVALGQPKEKISVEMVFRSLYYVAKSVERGENPDIVTSKVQRAKLFGLVKAIRK